MWLSAYLLVSIKDEVHLLLPLTIPTKQQGALKMVCITVRYIFCSAYYYYIIHLSTSKYIHSVISEVVKLFLS